MIRDNVEHILVAIVTLAVIVAIITVVVVPTLAYQNKKVAVFEAAVEAGMIQEMRIGDDGYIWVQP